MLLKKDGVACMKLTGSDDRTAALNTARLALQTALARMRRQPEICLWFILSLYLKMQRSTND